MCRPTARRPTRCRPPRCDGPTSPTPDAVGELLREVVAVGDHPPGGDHPAGLLRPAGAGPSGQRRRDAAISSTPPQRCRRRHDSSRPPASPPTAPATRIASATCSPRTPRCGPPTSTAPTRWKPRSWCAHPGWTGWCCGWAACSPQSRGSTSTWTPSTSKRRCRSTAGSRPSTCAMSHAPSSPRPPRRWSARRC